MSEQTEQLKNEIKENLTFNSEVTFMLDRVMEWVCQHLEAYGYRKVTMSQKQLEEKVSSATEVKKPLRYYSYDSSTHHLYTAGIYRNEIEEARTDVIDVLQIYESIGKELLAHPFVTGRNALSEGEEYLLLSYDGTLIAKSSFYVKNDSFYVVTTELNENVVLPSLQNHEDTFGKMYPPYLAPVQALILPLQANAAGIRKKCAELKDELNKNGIRTEVYETSYALGELAQLKGKGYPFLITFGPKDMDLGQAEIYIRNKEEKITLPLCSLVTELKNLMNQYHGDLYNAQVKALFTGLKKSLTFDETKNQKLMWCGKKECLNTINERNNKTIILPFNQLFFSQKCCICGEKAIHLIDVLNL